MFSITCKGREETARVAGLLAPLLRTGDSMLLKGQLAGGKTALVQYLVAALGSKAEVTSPTFTIAQFYPMPPAPGWNRVLMQDQFDSVLYLSAKPPTMTIMPKSLCLDAAYMKMRIARLNAVAPAAVDDLKKLCADLTR